MLRRPQTHPESGALANFRSGGHDRSMRCLTLSEFDLFERISSLPGVKDTQTSLLFNSFITP